MSDKYMTQEAEQIAALGEYLKGKAQYEQSRLAKKQSPFLKSSMIRTEVSGWATMIKVAVIGLVIAFLALGGITSVFALFQFMPWYVWAIIGFIVWMLISR